MNFDNLVNCDCLNGKKNGEKWGIGNCKQCSCEVRSHILFFVYMILFTMSPSRSNTFVPVFDGSSINIDWHDHFAW